MEIYDVAIISSLFGGVAGFWFCKFKTNSDRDFDYARGHSDAANALWPYIRRAWRIELAALHVKPTAGAASGDSDSTGRSV